MSLMDELVTVKDCREWLGKSGQWCRAVRALDSDYCPEHSVERNDWLARMGGGKR